MSTHIDLLTDVGPKGVRSVQARRHVAACAECRRLVTSVARLAQLYARVGGAGRLRSPVAIRRDCIPTDQLLRLASPAGPAPDKTIQSHLETCAECSMALEEARLAIAPQEKARAIGAAIKPLPDYLKDQIRAMRQALPLAAIPRNITRPSKSRSAEVARRPTRKKRSD